MVEKSWMGKRHVRVGIFIFLVVMGIAGSSFLYYHNPMEIAGPPCMVHKLTGLYCPGCGAGRASYSLLHGQFYQAFRYNPLLIILLPWLVLYFAICAVQWVMWGREFISERIPAWVTWGVLFVVLVYGVLRNIPLYPFTLLAPTKLF